MGLLVVRPAEVLFSLLRVEEAELVEVLLDGNLSARRRRWSESGDLQRKRGGRGRTHLRIASLRELLVRLLRPPRLPSDVLGRDNVEDLVPCLPVVILVRDAEQAGPGDRGWVRVRPEDHRVRLFVSVELRSRPDLRREQ